MNQKSRFAVASLLFFASGFASLIYQVVWQKRIFTLLGSDVFATSMVVSSFMLGLAIGSHLIGKFADRLRRRLALYGLLEILVGLYALAFHSILLFLQPRLHALYNAHLFDKPWLYLAIKFFLLFIVLLPPTILMGATLPLMVRTFSQESGRDVKGVVGWFYSFNTFGAFSGVLLSGFVLIRMIGLRATSTVAILTSLGTGLAAMLLPRAREAADATPDAAPTPAAAPADAGNTLKAGWIALATLFIGFSMMALEVIWTRMLVQYFSATVDSFAIVLLFVLLGIFWGSFKARHLAPDVDPLRRTFIKLIVILGLYLAFCGLLFNFAPQLFSRIVLVLVAIAKSKASWLWITLFCKMLIAAIFVLVPCYLSGMLFPVATQLYSGDPAAAGRTTSRLYVANTVGSVLGPLAAAFLLIPLLGIRSSLVAVSLILVLLGMLLTALAKSPLRMTAIALACGLALAALTALQPTKVFANYAVVSPRTKIVFHQEGFYQTISLLRNEKGRDVFMIDGNVEADNHPVQLRQFVLKSHLPMLLYDGRADVLVIGMGMGITLGALEKNPWVNTIDVVELSPEVIRAQRFLKEINGDALRFPRLRVINDDGRNYLAATAKKYQMITIDPIHPRVSGVGTLYTREFYSLVKSRLSSDGIFAQWMPSYQMSPQLFRVAVRTFQAAFPEAFLWYTKGHFLMVGHCQSPRFDYPRLREKFSLIQPDMAAIGIPTIDELLGVSAMTPAALRAYARGNPAINTDDNLLLEYAAPADYLYRVEDIIADALPFFAFPKKYITGATSEEMTRLLSQWQKRRDHVLAEAAEPLD